MSACTLYSLHYSSDHRNLVHEVYEIHNSVAWRFTVLYQLQGHATSNLTRTNTEEEKIRHLNVILISCGESRHCGFVITSKTNVMVQRPEEVHSHSAGTLILRLSWKPFS